jgi:hypothetical protein
MRLPQMMLRRWMFAVAILALSLFSARMVWTSFIRWKRAEGYERLVV